MRINGRSIEYQVILFWRKVLNGQGQFPKEVDQDTEIHDNHPNHRQGKETKWMALDYNNRKIPCSQPQTFGVRLS